MDGRALPCVCQLPLGILAHSSILEEAQSKKKKMGRCWVLSTDFHSAGSASSILCCANMDMDRDVLPDSAVSLVLMCP